MPKSRVRKKALYTPPPVAKKKHGQPWIAPAMVTFFVLGIIWLVVYYITNGDLPVGIGNWNLAVGFGFICAGFGFATQWR